MQGQTSLTPSSLPPKRDCSSKSVSDEFYDRGSTFPRKCLLTDWAPQPKIVGMPMLFRKMAVLYTWAMGLFVGMQCDFR